jgi:hypothetical protein
MKRLRRDKLAQGADFDTDWRFLDRLKREL